MLSDSHDRDQFSSGVDLVKQWQEAHYEYNQRDCVFSKDFVKLYHYQALKKKPHAIPVLVTFATVNRPEVLDLFPERSFIHGLLAQGIDVYLIDWGYPTQQQKDISLDDYICQYFRACVQFIKQQHKRKSINLIGICQGGIMSICHAALEKDINKLVLISTPIDFHSDDNKIYQLLKNIDVETLVSLSGNLPGEWLISFFISLRPFELVGEKYLKFTDRLTDSEWTSRFIRMEKWLHDSPDQTGASFLQLVKDFYLENRLYTEKLLIGGRPVILRQLTMPVLNIIAEQDEIVPPSASKPLRKFINPANYTEQTYPSGHIGIYVSDKVGSTLPKQIATWLKK